MELKKSTDLRIVKIPKNHVISPYFIILGMKTGRSHALVHVQFAYGMFENLRFGKFKSLNSFTALLFYLGLTFGNSQVVTTFHELNTEMRAGGKAGLIYTKFLNKLICIVSDLIVVHTNENKKTMEKIYGIDRFKLKVIPMGILENPILLDKNACKRELGLSNKKVITIPGFISKHKGHESLIRILPKLEEDVQLLIAGGARTSEDEVYYQELKNLAANMNCIDRITFNDDFPISPVILNATDIAILPYTSASESMALRLLVAYQIPTITSDLSVFKEIYNEYHCIELFNNCDEKGLLEKIQELMYDEKTRECLKEKCRKMWNSAKWSVIAAKHVETYMEVFSAHPDALYDTEKQKERLNWLKTNLYGNTLEIGCATGFVANYTGAHVGLDLNLSRLMLAKKRYPEKDFILSNALYLPFKDKAFNTVLIPEILEHIPLPISEKIVHEAEQIGEKVLITLPNAGKVNYDKSLVETPEHVWYPTEEIVKGLIKECKIEYTTKEDFILVTVT
jgi:glycosyltransferase involved in cell wall biosynthesis